MRRRNDRPRVVELLPAMLLSAMIVAGAHATPASSSPDESSIQITVTTIR